MLAQYVIKVSKLCNLRCTYCYEYPELANPARMSVGDLDSMFSHIAEHYRDEPSEKGIRFIWHGGEPLIQPPAYYREIFASQKRRFGDRQIANDVQTNLMQLDDERIELLRTGFNGVGVSIDVFGDLRLNVAGKPSQAKVLENMERLQDAGVLFGCITVLSRNNIAKVDRIFRFYEALSCSFRLLPLFQGATEEQNQGCEVTGREVLDALCQVTDLWLASESKIHVAPITDQMADLLRRRAPWFVPGYYERRTNESVVLVNTNGDLYSQGDAFVPGRAWGNIFRSPMRDILQSDARKRSVLAAETRMARACVRCEYFGACDGFAVAEDNRHYRDTVGAQGGTACVVERGLYRHLERRLREAEEEVGSDLRARFEAKMETPRAPAFDWADIAV